MLYVGQRSNMTHVFSETLSGDLQQLKGNYFEGLTDARKMP